MKSPKMVFVFVADYGQKKTRLNKAMSQGQSIPERDFSQSRLSVMRNPILYSDHMLVLFSRHVNLPVPACTKTGLKYGHHSVLFVILKR